MGELKLDRQSLKKFGIVMGVAFLVLTLLTFIKHKHITMLFPAISGTFFIIAFTVPGLLKPIYIFWMKLALVLGWINTRLILSVLFYLIFTPIGIGMKLFGADLLDRKIDKQKESYWRKKDLIRTDYQRQF